MLDYHLHLWPHSESSTACQIDQVAQYCEEAAAAGVTELALTEHLHRFVEMRPILRRHLERAGGPEPVREAMAAYFDFHARTDLDAYVTLCEEAKAQGLPVVTGLEVDYYEDQMGEVAALLADYPFDVLLGSVHWLGAWQFDDLDAAAQMAEWDARDVDACWDGYTAAIEELAQSGACDVLAHPDLIKLAGRIPAAPAEWWDRLAEAAAHSQLSAELSSAGWGKPVGEQYPSAGLLARFVDRGVTLTTASDAHELGRVAHRADDLRALLADHGVGELASYRGRERVLVRVADAKK
jgi:histidinol-phosphatase (PHP family)